MSEQLPLLALSVTMTKRMVRRRRLIKTRLWFVSLGVLFMTGTPSPHRRKIRKVGKKKIVTHWWSDVDMMENGKGQEN